MLIHVKLKHEGVHNAHNVQYVCVTLFDRLPKYRQSVDYRLVKKVCYKFINHWIVAKIHYTNELQVAHCC